MSVLFATSVYPAAPNFRGHADLVLPLDKPLEETVQFLTPAQIQKMGLNLPVAVRNNKVAAEAGETYSVKFNDVTPSTCPYAAFAAFAMSEEGKLYECELMPDFDINELVLDLPEGTYDFVTVFENIDESLEGLTDPVLAFVVKENVAVGAQTDIDMSAADAINRISFRQTMPDGSELLLPEILSFDDEGVPTYNKDENSWNCYQLFVRNMLVREDGNVWGIDLSPSFRLWNGQSAETATDLLISPVSEKWSVCQTRVPVAASIDFSIYAETKASEAKEINVTSSDFTLYELGFKHTAGTKDGRINTKYAQGMVSLYLINGMIPNTSYTIPSRTCSAEDGPRRYIATLCGQTLSPYVTYFKKEGTTEVMGADMECAILAAPISVSDGKLQCVVAGGEIVTLDGGATAAFYLDKMDGKSHPLAPGHPLFSYQPSEMDGVYGNSVPVLSLTTVDFAALMGETSAKWNLPIMCSYQDRFGGNRLSDIQLAKYVVTHGGETQFENPCIQFLQFELMNFYPYNPAFTDEMVWRFENTNIDVDGLAGSNITELKYHPSNTEADAPTMRFLQMRNKEGKITDRFATPADGVINFAAADYEVEMDPVYGNSECSVKDVEVKVEFAPYGTEDYASLEVKALPEQFVNSGLGHIFTCATEGIEKMSDTGWFNLRFTLTDEAGNTQVQTLAPAFKIESLTGVETVKASEMAFRVEGKNIIADGHADIYSVNGSRVDGLNLPAGVYIVKMAGKATKVVIR